MTAQPHLTVAVVLIVIGAGALHAAWNAIAERFGTRRVAAAVVIAAGIVLITT